MVEEEVREIGSTRRDSNMPLVEIDEAMSKNVPRTKKSPGPKTSSDR